MIEAIEGKSVWRYGARAVGVKKRGRKKDRHSSAQSNGQDILEVTGVPDLEKAKQLALTWAESHMKSWDSLHATLTYWTIEDGFAQWQPFNKDHNLKVSVEP